MAEKQQWLLRRTALGSEAVYLVIAEYKELVEVEIVSALGLEPGMRMKLTRQAVEAMERLGQVQAESVPPVKFSSAPDLR